MKINNEVYDELGNRWYEAQDDPIALLRAEARLISPWVHETISENLGEGRMILDIGSGGGFHSNYLSMMGHEVSGIDLSLKSLLVAESYDETSRVRYQKADALALPYRDQAFDSVLVMDFLEHVEDANSVIKEATRVLKPGGLLFFHTFNRNILSRMIVLHGVEWFVKNVPERMHLYRLFRKPEELERILNSTSVDLSFVQGTRPVIGIPFVKLLFTGVVPYDFQFTFSPKPLMGYVGYGVRR